MQNLHVEQSAYATCIMNVLSYRISLQVQYFCNFLLVFRCIFVLYFYCIVCPLLLVYYFIMHFCFFIFLFLCVFYVGLHIFVSAAILA